MATQAGCLSPQEGFVCEERRPQRTEAPLSTFRAGTAVPAPRSAARQLSSTRALTPKSGPSFLRPQPRGAAAP